MTREQAICYLFSSGFTEEQVSDVVRALTYKPISNVDKINKLIEELKEDTRTLAISQYNKGYADGMKAALEHKDLCREEQD